jgi:hypothetical protein
MCGIRTPSIKGQPNHIPKMEMSMLEILAIFLVGFCAGLRFSMTIDNLFNRKKEGEKYESNT